MLVLPFALPCDACCFRGFDGVVSGSRGMTGDMDCRDSLTGRARGGAGRRVIGSTGSSMGG